jgi:hypothetical protein
MDTFINGIIKINNGRDSFDELNDKLNDELNDKLNDKLNDELDDELDDEDYENEKQEILNHHLMKMNILESILH